MWLVLRAVEAIRRFCVETGRREGARRLSQPSKLGMLLAWAAEGMALLGGMLFAFGADRTCRWTLNGSGGAERNQGLPRVLGLEKGIWVRC